MTERRSERRLVRYFCTAGNGMEHFLADEVKRKLAAEDVCQMPGKVLFSSSVTIVRVSELKAAERLFLLLKQESPVRLSGHTNAAKAASVLQSRLFGDINEWTSAVMTWSHLQGELAGRRTTVNIPSTSLKRRRKKEEGRESEEQRKEEEKCDEELRKSTGEQREEESGVRRGEKMSRETCRVEARTLEKKRKRGDEEDASSDKNVEKQRTSEIEITREDDKEERRVIMEFASYIQSGNKGMISETDLNGRGSVCDHTTPQLDHDVESSSRNMDNMAEDCAVENVEHVKTARGGDKTLLQPSRNKQQQPPSSALVSFRINCKCTGSLSRYLSIQEVSKVIGTGLTRLLGWKADLRNPQLEVNVYLSDDHCLLGIPLTRLPLANRSYIKTTGLRSTVAWAMASLAQIQPGFCVVDPMCGAGIILIEAAQEHKDVCFMAMDNDDGQLQKANENIVFAELGNRIHLLKASSMVLPLPSASVDAVVCDLPFGRKFGTKTNMAANLPLILTEMERVLCFGGTLVLLLSPQLSCLLKKLLAQKGTEPTSNQETELTELQHSPPHPLSSLKHQTTLRVSLGAIDGLIHKYIKTDT
ncbi:hypothetical protein PAMP_001410 [Pampus punctatissimus]